MAEALGSRASPLIGPPQHCKQIRGTGRSAGPSGSDLRTKGRVPYNGIFFFFGNKGNEVNIMAWVKLENFKYLNFFFY